MWVSVKPSAAHHFSNPPGNPTTTPPTSKVLPEPSCFSQPPWSLPGPGHPSPHGQMGAPASQLVHCCPPAHPPPLQGNSALTPDLVSSDPQHRLGSVQLTGSLKASLIATPLPVTQPLPCPHFPHSLLPPMTCVSALIVGHLPPLPGGWTSKGRKPVSFPSLPQHPELVRHKAGAPWSRVGAKWTHRVPEGLTHEMSSGC